MWKLSKVIVFIIILTVVMSCTKSQEDKKGTVNLAAAKEVTDAHDHNHAYELKEGDLPIDPVASKVASFSMEGKYDEAIKVLLEAKDIPGYQWDAKRLYDSIIYLYDKTKQYEKNLKIWRDAHNKGIVFNMDITKPHFQPYLGLEGFDKILDKDIEMQNEAKKINIKME
ncbi:MAG: hypothetical protein KAH33_00870 [Candidatus Delongbacteria bacterium]|nr:hypothetical protein [Candidatus Delongbacteria bacterium]